MIDTETDITTAIRCRNGELVVKRTQDCTPYLDQNQREYNEAPSWRPYATRRRGSKLRKVAEIPNILIEQWMKEGINVLRGNEEDQRRMRQKLDDLDFKKLRTFPGRVGLRRSKW